MKKLLFSVLTSIFLFSCSTEEHDSPSTTTQMKLKQKIANNVSEGYTLTTSYYYSGNALQSLTETHGVNTIKKEFVYSNGKIDRIKFYDNSHYLEDGDIDDSDYIVDGDMVYVYENNEIKTASCAGVSSQYTYSSLGQMTTEIINYWGGFDSENILIYYPDGNIESYSFSETPFNNGSGTTYYTYDTNKNPEYYTFPKDLCKIWQISPNNILSADVWTYEYKYNDSGYPIEEIAKQYGTTIWETTWLYQ